MKIRTLALVGAAGLALAACSGNKSEDTSANETIVANIGAPDNFANVTIH
jgi:ABC-type glycerol-3-phosphate transport system substrate-binding protein